MHPATLLTIGFTLLSPTMAFADGYPFFHGTHEVIGDGLQLFLSDEQVLEVSATGLLTFTVKQHALLSKFYTKAPKKIRVISSTYNDGLDVRDPNPVDCIWTSPRNVVITLDEKQEEGDYTFDTEPDSWSLFRISPGGDLYSRGAKITKEDAITLIQKHKDTLQRGPKDLAVTLPPPNREIQGADDNARVKALYEELVEIGKQHGVTVRQCW